MGRVMKISPTTPPAAARVGVRIFAGSASAPGPRTAFRSLMFGVAKSSAAPEPGRALAVRTQPRGPDLAARGAHEPPAVDRGLRETRDDGDMRDDGDTRAPGDEQALDPSVRHAAQLAPPMQASDPPPADAAKAEVARRGSLEELLPALVRRIAWGGDARRGSVRIELGAGELAGGTVVVHADDGCVRVELTVPSGIDSGVWRERIERRLVARGLDVASVDVR